jgi:cytochrome P450
VTEERIVSEEKPIPVADGPVGLAILKELVRDRSLLTAMGAMHSELGEIFQITMPRFQPIVVAGPELNRQVLVTDRDKFKWRSETDPITRLLRHGLLVSDGEEHDYLRACMEPSLRRAPSLKHMPTMLHYTDRILAQWPEEGEVDMLVEMRKIALVILFGTLFSTDFTPQMEVLWDPIMKALHYVSPGPWIVWPDMPRPGYKKAFAALDSYFYGLIRQRREEGGPEDDLLAMLMNAPGPDGSAHMDDDLIRDQLLTMLIAGHDTSTAMLAWALYLLGEHPQVLAQATEEALHFQIENLNTLGGRQLPLLDQVIKETLRLFPPAHVGNRFAMEKLDLQGYPIEEGTRVMVSMYLTHRDDAIWEEPEQFCPQRFDRSYESEMAERRPSMSYVPFGGGPRNCIGATFAQIEGKVVLARVLQQFDLQLSPGQRVRPYMGVTLEPRPGVKMFVKRRTENSQW